ncbi:short-chain fatty acid transporter [Arthrobacter sp. H14]|uniref:short-chain fatty acid transporter n=1 Tax=Arthrobacter sp. H14 TaxID=1312959 RepID=UPI00047CE86C|nr:TIGR00366 family protein [Arthrobacter sp. H14]
MLQTLSRPLSRFVERWLPGPLILAVILTMIVGVMALTMTDISPVDLVLGWGDGLTGLLAFMTQVSLVLLLGYTLANTRPVHRLLVRVASLPRTPRQAYGFVTIVAGIASLISFGLGLIVGGVMAVEVARAAKARGTKLHYPLLVASAYSGFVVWHMGYSGSGPLNAATEGGAYSDLPGGLVDISRTTFSTWNIIATIVTLVVVAGAMMLLAPKKHDEIVPAPDSVFADDDGGSSVSADSEGNTKAAGADAATKVSRTNSKTGPGATTATTATPSNTKPTPADRIENLRVFTLALGVLLGLYLTFYFSTRGFELTLDIVNWSFLCLIMLLVGNARELAGLIARGGRTVGEVLLQYPLYAGIIGMMSVSGLVGIISGFFIDISSPATLGLWTFLSAGLLNMFIPSGGGQFAVMAPLFAEAANALGVDQSVVIMAISYGDQWTNMIQPFWAIPLLAVAGLKVREILGYTLITLILSGIVFAGTMLIVGAG